MLTLCVAALRCGSQTPVSPTAVTPPSQSPVATPSDPPPVGPAVSGGTEVFVGAGDIGACDQNSEATARLLDGIGGTVFTLGDHAYPRGTEEQFRNCYEPTWGRHKGRTRPSPGNHDYESSRTAAPYFDYFGLNAGPAGVGYYSFQVGSWLVLSMNSNANIPAQVTWMKNLLERNRARCTLAYWHHSLFSSGEETKMPAVRDWWDALYQAGADVVLSSHDHLYERFAPQDQWGGLDPDRGIREFVVGTGGAPLHRAGPRAPNSEALISTFGVLKLTLGADGYDWQFVSVSGPGDSGTGRCH